MAREYKSPEIDYEVKDICGAYRYRAMHYAVFTPICGRKWLKHGRHGVCMCVKQLRKAWNVRLKELQAAEWMPLDTRRAHTYMRNCPPFGVRTDRMDTRPCKRASLCPNCYARYMVFDSFTYLEQVLYGTTDPFTPDGHQRRSLYPHMNVIDFKIPITPDPELRLPPWTPYAITHEHCARLKHHMRANNGEKRQTEVAALRVLAAAVLYKVYPESNQGVLKTTRCGVIITPDDRFPTDLADYFAAEGGTWNVRSTTKGDLCQAVVSAMSYPAKLLTAPAWEVAAMLDGLRRVHMIAQYGKNNLHAGLKANKKRF